MNSEKTMENFLNLKYEIENNVFSKTIFKNKEVEEKFQIHSANDSTLKSLVSNLLVVLGYFATFLYIVFAYYRLIFLLICCICFILTVISIYLSAKSHSLRFKCINYQIQIFLSSFNLWIKGLIVITYYGSKDTDNSQELLRIIIYEFVSTNIFLIVKLEACFKTSLFYFFQNLILISFAHIYSNRNNYFFLEGITSFFVSIIFYSLRKEWDIKLRKIFSEKIKFEIFFSYVSDYLLGLNGYNINIQNNTNIFFNEKFNKLVDGLFYSKFLPPKGNNKKTIENENTKIFEFFESLNFFEKYDNKNEWTNNKETNSKNYKSKIIKFY